MTRRWFALGARFLALLALCPLGACGTSSHPITLENREEAEDFHRSLQAYSSAIDAMLEQTRHGQKVSDFSLGMLTYNILTTLSSADGDLRTYVTAGGQDVQGYLKTRFQAQPEQEIATLDRMSSRNSSPIEYSARYTLEALTHIPNSDDPPDVQQESRQELVSALERAKTALKETAQEIRFH